MRGVVTIAAAAGTPLATAAGSELPGRDALIPIAFFVAIGTLLIQGTTLPWLIRLLGISADEDATWRRGQLAFARDTMRRATTAALDDLRSRSLSERDIRLAETMLRRLRRSRVAASETGDDPERLRRLDVAAMVLTFQRRALIEQRDALRLDDEILRELLEQIDLEQAVIARRSDGQEPAWH